MIKKGMLATFEKEEILPQHTGCVVQPLEPPVS